MAKAPKMHKATHTEAQMTPTGDQKNQKWAPKYASCAPGVSKRATKSKALSPNDCERILKDLVKIRSAHYFATSSHMQTDRICMNGPHFHSLENALNTCNAIALGGPS